LRAHDLGQRICPWAFLLLLFRSFAAAFGISWAQ
jgi:hypothetical protein